MSGIFSADTPMAPTTSSIHQASPTSTGSTPTPSNIGPNGPRGPPNSTLLFGFLVSFLALFIIFMVGGLGSRHYLDLRRRERRLLEANELDVPTELSPPGIWDIAIAPGDDEKWKSLMPLSVEVQRSETAKEADTSSEALRAQQTLAFLAQLSVADRFFYSCGEFCQRLFTAMRNPPGRRFESGQSNPQSGATSGKPNTSDDVNLQISVIVAMPSPHSHSRQQPSSMPQMKDNYDINVLQDEGSLPDFAIGITNVHGTGSGLISFEKSTPFLSTNK